MNNRAFCCYKETVAVSSHICDLTRGIRPDMATALVNSDGLQQAENRNMGKHKVQGESATKLTTKSVPTSSLIWCSSGFVINFISANQCHHLLQANSCLCNIQSCLLAAAVLAVHQSSIASKKQQLLILVWYITARCHIRLGPARK